MGTWYAPPRNTAHRSSHTACSARQCCDHASSYFALVCFSVVKLARLCAYDRPALLLQAKNMDDALAKMQSFIDAAVQALTPTIADESTVKKVKKQIAVGKEKRLDKKKMNSQKKADRKRKDWD
eukprot:363939-Chlamydomonas_euryale.AAC.7